MSKKVKTYSYAPALARIRTDTIPSWMAPTTYEEAREDAIAAAQREVEAALKRLEKMQQHLAHIQSLPEHELANNPCFPANVGGKLVVGQPESRSQLEQLARKAGVTLEAE